MLRLVWLQTHKILPSASLSNSCNAPSVNLFVHTLMITGKKQNLRTCNCYPSSGSRGQWRGGLSVTGGANTQTATPPPPPPRTQTQTHMQNFLSRYRAGCRILARRGWVPHGSLTRRRQGRARAKRAKIFVVRVLIFPQIVLETMAINTSK